MNEDKVFGFGLQEPDSLSTPFHKTIRMPR
jgi:hypothetical protein